MSSIGGGGTERRNENSFTIFDADLGAIFSAGAMFTARGFSYSTIRALVVAGIDAPELDSLRNGDLSPHLGGLTEQGK